MSMAAEHELVLVCARILVQEGLVSRLRALLPRHQIVAMLMEPVLQHFERLLIEELLDEGKIPLILLADEAAAARLADWDWLEPDRCLALPARAA